MGRHSKRDSDEAEDESAGRRFNLPTNGLLHLLAVVIDHLWDVFT